MRKFSESKKRRQSWLQKGVSTVCDAILSASLMSKHTGHFVRKHLDHKDTESCFKDKGPISKVDDSRKHHLQT